MEEEFKNQSILGRDLVDEMEESYLSYAMSVIISRALPDVRDGLKPVHRRVLYGAAGIGAQWNRKHKKSARIVGEVIGKYTGNTKLNVGQTIHFEFKKENIHFFDENSGKRVG